MEHGKLRKNWRKQVRKKKDTCPTFVVRSGVCTDTAPRLPRVLFPCSPSVHLSPHPSIRPSTLPPIHAIWLPSYLLVAWFERSCRITNLPAVMWCNTRVCVGTSSSGRPCSCIGSTFLSSRPPLPEVSLRPSTFVNRPAPANSGGAPGGRRSAHPGPGTEVLGRCAWPGARLRFDQKGATAPFSLASFG